MERTAVTSWASQTFHSLRHRNYSLFWAASIIGSSGFWILLVAQGWLVFELTKSAFWLGLIQFCGSVPMLLLSAPGGVLADRVNRQKLLIWAQGIYGLLAALLAILMVTGLITIWQIIIISLCGGLVWSMADPARMALLPSLVPEDDLMNAVALNATSWQASRFIGPATAGVLIGFIGIGGCFFTTAIAYGLTVVALSLIRVSNIPSQSREKTLWRNLMEGLGYIGRNAIVLALILLAAILSLLALPYAWLMPVFADILGVGISGYSQLMALTGAGALAGALLVASLGNFRRKGWLLFGSAFMFTASLIFFVASPWFPVSLGLAVIVAGTSGVFFAIATTLVQTIIPDELRGRVMGVYVLTWSLPAVGSLPLGAVSDRLGAPLVIGLGSLVCILFTLVVAIRLPQLRRFQ